jgi:hypothetical protein
LGWHAFILSKNGSLGYLGEHGCPRLSKGSQPAALPVASFSPRLDSFGGQRRQALEPVDSALNRLVCLSQTTMDVKNLKSTIKNPLRLFIVLLPTYLEKKRSQRKTTDVHTTELR